MQVQMTLGAKVKALAKLGPWSHSSQIDGAFDTSLAGAEFKFV
jgi:hypothetical protein